MFPEVNVFLLIDSMLRYWSSFHPTNCLPLNGRQASLVDQMVKNLPAVQEIWVRSLGWEDPLKNGMATHSSILDWRILWTEEPGRLQSMGLQSIGYKWVTFTSHPYFKDNWLANLKSSMPVSLTWSQVLRISIQLSLWVIILPTTLFFQTCCIWDSLKTLQVIIIKIK